MFYADAGKALACIIYYFSEVVKPKDFVREMQYSIDLGQLTMTIIVDPTISGVAKQLNNQNLENESELDQLSLPKEAQAGRSAPSANSSIKAENELLKFLERTIIITIPDISIRGQNDNFQDTTDETDGG